MTFLRSIWYYLTAVFVTAYWSTAVVLGALVGVKYRKGGLYDQAARGWGGGFAARND